MGSDVSLKAPTHCQTQPYDWAGTYKRYAIYLIGSTEFLQQLTGSYD